MLEIRPIMNTSAEDILSFRTCCSIRVWDQNLEIHVINNGREPVVVPSYFDLENNKGIKRIETLMPAGEHRIDPGQMMAFYCYMDEVLWKEARRIVFYDSEGNAFGVEIEKSVTEEK